MSLIYPREAWRRFGPPPIWVHDARGRLLRYVIACNPETGEVISHVGSETWLCFVLTHLGLARTCNSHCQRTLWRLLRAFGMTAAPGEMVKCHWLAPAPLTITSTRTPEEGQP